MNKQFSRRSLLGGVAAASIVPFVSAVATPRLNAQTPVNTPYLVSPQWLADRIERAEPSLLVMDLSDLRPYRSAHIPGAIHSWWMETVERDYPYFGTVLNQLGIDSNLDNQGKRRDWFNRHGIGPETHVITYDRDQGDRAARIVWFLRFLGHERASMLEGGLDGWLASSLATTRGEVDPPGISTEPSIVPADGFYVATSRLAELLDAGDITLVDVRTEAERLDTVDGQFATGVIPGSIHLPRDNDAFKLSAAPGHFDPLIAQETLARTGIVAEGRVVLYGRFGSDANQMWIALKACGYPAVEIYDRGWVEWSKSGRSSLPIS